MSAPTKPGWWWRRKPTGAIEAVEVLPYGTSALMWGPRRYTVTGSPSEGWLCEVPTPERIAADAKRLERYADALTRIEWGEATPERIAYRAIMGVVE